jgi:hypothetical protein
MQASYVDQDAQMYAEMLEHHKQSVHTRPNFMTMRQPSRSQREQVPDMASTYFQTNSGLDHRIATNSGLHAICPEECDVYDSLLESCDGGFITPGINHSIDANGDVEGFRFTCSPNNTAKCLPVNRKMFFRTSMVNKTQCPRYLIIHRLFLLWKPNNSSM